MTGIFIVARLGSTRLSKKHLIKAAGKTFIEWLAERFLTAFENEINSGEVKVFITTSDADVQNKQFEEVFSNEPNVNIFYGSDENIPLHQLQCAKKHRIDKIVSVDGDDILCSTYAAKRVHDALNRGSKRASTSGLPLGTNIAGYLVTALEDGLATNHDLKLETGWGRIFDLIPTETISLEGERPDLRLTLDYPEDAVFFTTVIEGLGPETLIIEDSKLINYILDNKINEINGGLNQAYLANFANQKNKESSHE